MLTLKLYYKRFEFYAIKTCDLDFLVNKMEHIIFVNKEFVDGQDPHGYCECHIPTIQAYSQRSFLSDCINQIYLMNNFAVPNVDTSAESDENIIRNTLDMVIAPPKMCIYAAAVERVKKRLFPDSKRKSRKMQKPWRKRPLPIECLYFKPKRHLLGRYKSRRTLQYQQLKAVHMEHLHRERIFANEKLLEASVRSLLYMRVLMGLVVDY